MNYWLLKTEPGVYSYDDLERGGETVWEGVRGWQARANLRKMAPGDLAFIYHTGRRPAIVGVATVTAGPYRDPTDETGRWLAVTVAPRYPLPEPVTLSAIRAHPDFSGWELVRSPRLSVIPVLPENWERVLAMAQQKVRW